MFYFSLILCIKKTLWSYWKSLLIFQWKYLFIEVFVDFSLNISVLRSKEPKLSGWKCLPVWMLLSLCGPKVAIIKCPKKSLLTFSHYCTRVISQRGFTKSYLAYFLNYPVLATKLNISISYKNRLLLLFGSELSSLYIQWIQFRAENIRIIFNQQIYTLLCLLKKMGYGLSLEANYKIGFEVHTIMWRWALLHINYRTLFRS